MRALIGQKPIVYCTGKHHTQRYARTRELRTLVKQKFDIYFRVSLTEISITRIPLISTCP